MQCPYYRMNSKQELQSKKVYYLQIIHKNSFGPVIKVIYTGINPEMSSHKKTVLFRDETDGFITVANFSDYTLKGSHLFIKEKNLLEDVVGKNEEEYADELLKKYGL